MLVKNKSIEQLNIGGCGITAEGIELLKSGLMFNSTLKVKIILNLFDII